MTADELRALVARIEYKDWAFSILHVGEAGFFLQLRWRDEKDEPQSGRKWYVSKHATRSEVVQTLLAAVLAAEEHEARERFLFDGHAVFGPHFDVIQLRRLAERGEQALDVRKPA